MIVNESERIATRRILDSSLRIQKLQNDKIDHALKFIGSHKHIYHDGEPIFNKEVYKEFLDGYTN
jgi:hypothetical protein